MSARLEVQWPHFTIISGNKAIPATETKWKLYRTKGPSVAAAVNRSVSMHQRRYQEMENPATNGACETKRFSVAA
ncbi:MAG: hypothetical protein J7555_09850, partial [Chloroflexi bacterium]|nr:hypothetical protein [Chloroflexota bacterium]